MRTSREQTVQTRERVINTASRLFRERGINGIGVADLMHDAGLTHGGFYKHFESKQALIAAACTSALALTQAELANKIAGARDADGLAVLVSTYLAKAHRDHPGQGCAIAAIGNEAVRGDGLAKAALAEGVERLLSLISEQLARADKDDTGHTAHGVLAALVGGLILSRLMQGTTRSHTILRDTRDFILPASLESV